MINVSDKDCAEKTRISCLVHFFRKSCIYGKIWKK